MIHLLQFGHTACQQNGPPSTWPAGHRWTSRWEEVTCPGCLAGRELIATYKIAADGQSITCLRCGLESHHPGDVEHHYCGRCHVCHDDIWPPARKAWLASGKQ